MNKDYPEDLDEFRRAEYRAEKKRSTAEERKATKALARKESLVNPRRK